MRGQPVRRGGVPVERARLVAICIHGRGASAEDILSLGDELGCPTSPTLRRRPPARAGIPIRSSRRSRRTSRGSRRPRHIARLIAEVAAQGVPQERVALLGFSQGACLSLEFAARHAGRYAAVVGLSGGLIGPPGTPRTTRERSTARRCSSAAATSTRTSRSSGCASPPTSSAGWAPRWTSGFTRAWATPSIVTSSRRWSALRGGGPGMSVTNAAAAAAALSASWVRVSPPPDQRNRQERTRSTTIPAQVTRRSAAGCRDD